MACRSCKRQLLLLARQANTPVAAELCSAALGQQLLQQVASIPIAQRQIRGFRSTPTRSGIMDSIRNTVQRSSQPYRVVAATKEIYDACSKAALYKIDPIAIKAGTIPKTPEGEDIGEGKGMWHDGMHSKLLVLLSLCLARPCHYH